MSASSDRAADAFRDIVENIEAIETYLGGVSQPALAEDRRTIDAIERCLMRISEAAIRAGERATEICPRQPWRDIRGLGNHLRHRYDRVQFELIWLIVTRDLPSLKRDLVNALRDLERR